MRVADLQRSIHTGALHLQLDRWYDPALPMLVDG